MENNCLETACANLYMERVRKLKEKNKKLKDENKKLRQVAEAAKKIINWNEENRRRSVDNYLLILEKTLIKLEE